MARLGVRASPSTLAVALVVVGAALASCLVRSEGCYTTKPDTVSLAIPPVTRTGTYPSLGRGDVAVGDGRTEWHLGFFGWVYVIPEGMELRGGGAAMVDFASPNGYHPLGVASVHDVASGSTLRLDVDIGGEVSRTICPSPDDVNSLFDQIIASGQRHAPGDRQ